MTGAQYVEYSSPMFIRARASRPICAPVSRHSERLKDIAVVTGYLRVRARAHARVCVCVFICMYLSAFGASESERELCVLLTLNPNTIPKP